MAMVPKNDTVNEGICEGDMKNYPERSTGGVKRSR